MSTPTEHKTMELRDFIDKAAEAAGSLSALARRLGTNQPDMTAFKTYRKHMPADIAVKLADFIGADRFLVIAASELATEKKEEKRAFWTEFVFSGKLAHHAVIATVAILAIESLSKAIELASLSA